MDLVTKVWNKGGRIKLILFYINYVNIIHNLHVTEIQFYEINRNLVGLAYRKPVRHSTW
jgi:hypothetical protein